MFPLFPGVNTMNVYDAPGSASGRVPDAVPRIGVSHSRGETSPNGDPKYVDTSLSAAASVV